jgi:hypothetical protein
VLTLVAEATDVETLTPVQHILGTYRARFGRRQELHVDWISGRRRRR